MQTGEESGAVLEVEVIDAPLVGCRAEGGVEGHCRYLALGTGWVVVPSDAGGQEERPALGADGGPGQ